MPAIAFDRFYRYAELTAILEACRAEYPQLVALESIGTSYEGRDILVSIVTNAATGPAEEKPAFWVDGNIHATEVAGSAATLYFLHTLLTQYGKDPDVTRGTLEGRIRAGGVTIFRLQSTADTVLRSYLAEGEVLDIDPKSFGGIGIIGIREMGRFYRHVLIEKRFPHHTAVAFDHAGKTLWAALRMLGVEDVSFNRPAGMLYPTENPF